MNIPNTDDAVLIDNQELIKTIESTTDATVKTSADTWSKGIAALFVIVGASAWIAGPTVISGLDAPARWIVLALVLAGTIAQLVALHKFLLVTAGTPTKLKLAEFSATKTVRAHLATARDTNAKRIERGRAWGLLGLVPFVIAFAIAVLVAPNTAKLNVVTADGSVCGVVVSADNSHIVLDIAGAEANTTIPFSDVVNLKAVAACG